MYHKVGEPVATRADRFLNVPTPSFRRQMRLLARLGFRAVTFGDLADGLAGRAELPAKPVCITFDDGYSGVATQAAPALRELGWPATIFAPTAHVGRRNDWDAANGKPVLPLLGWDELRALQGDGWEVAGHTRTHPRLADLPDEQALEEMRAGREELEERLSATVRTFCYPYGSANVRTPELAKEAGFVAACTTHSGWADAAQDPFLLPRVKVASRDDAWGLCYRLFIRPKLG